MIGASNVVLYVVLSVVLDVVACVGRSEESVMSVL